MAIDEMPAIDSPSPRSMAMAAARLSIDVFQTGLLQGLAHVVHVETQHAGGELRALLTFTRFALSRAMERLVCRGCRHYDHAVVVGDDDVPRIDCCAGADHRNVHRTQRGFHGALGADRPAPYRELHCSEL